MSADWFGGMGSATESGTGNWFRRGTYLVEIVRITKKISEDPAKKGARLVIAEFRIVETVSDYPGSGGEPGSQRPGETAAAMFDMSSTYKSREMFKLRSLISAALGDLTEPIAAAAAKIRADNPALDEAASIDAAWGNLAARVTSDAGEMLAGSRVAVDASSPYTTRDKKVIYPARFASPALKAA